MDTPFSYGKIVGHPEFTDREQEIKWLEQQVISKTNCMIISPRRWGKSSLVQTASEKMKRHHKKKIFCFIDLYNVRSEKEFYEVFSKEILRATSGTIEEIIRNAKEIFKQVIPKISFRPDPAMDFEIGFNWDEVKKNPSEILNLPEVIGKAKNKDIIICLDEFQNISFFDAPLAFQKKLRAHWQKHKNTVYCLYGSKKHLLTDFFTSPSMPFYRFGEILFLQKIPESYWISFITDRFQSTGKKITKEQAARIAALMVNHPYFVQQLAQSVWLRTTKKCNDETIEETVNELLDQYT
ncbi:MAG TPA: ATP-binding protein, partial [Flavisolibacter sp.]|nr:ATP-binding protein [Flavisolibacter sp.]